MKKIFSIVVILLLLSGAAMAQRGPGDRIKRHRVAQGFNDGRITRVERFQLHRDVTRYRMAERRARRDGAFTPHERRRVHALKAKTRRDAFRFQHNRRHRVI